MMAPEASSTVTAMTICVCDDDEIAGCQDELACNYNPNATDRQPANMQRMALTARATRSDALRTSTATAQSKYRMCFSYSQTSVAHRIAPGRTSTDGAVSVGDILLLLAAFGEEC